MKPIKLLIITFCSSLTLFISSEAKSQINVQTGNTTIKTNSAGGITISTEDTTINTNSNSVYDWEDYYEDYYFDEDGYYLRNYQVSPSMSGKYRSRGACKQVNRQTTQISGSNRRAIQRSSSNCY